MSEEITIQISWKSLEKGIVATIGTFVIFWFALLVLAGGSSGLLIRLTGEPLIRETVFSAIFWVSLIAALIAGIYFVFFNKS